MFDVSLTVGGRRRAGRPLTVVGERPPDRAADGAPALALTEFDNLVSRAPEIWGEDAPAPELLAHVVRDALASSFLGGGYGAAGAGFVGPVPSPLGAVDRAAFEAFAATQQALDELTSDGVRFTLGETTENGTPVVALEIGAHLAGALVCAGDAMVVPVAAGASTVEIRYAPDPGFQQRELDSALRGIEWTVGVLGETMLVWQLYQGSNTLAVHGVSAVARQGWHRIKLRAVQSAVLVARVVFAAHEKLPRRTTGDPFARRRRRSAERENPSVAQACLDVCEAPTAGHAVVVAVHGTMASAVHLAGVVGEHTAWPVLRYEHDTWQPITANARELGERLVALDVERAVLVGHSRGGLVARHAAQIATTLRPEMHLRLITFGTPFRGTPFPAAASTALMGGRALLGMVRLASGAVVVDSASWMAGLLLKLPHPAGLAVMDERSDYLGAFAHDPLSLATTVAGDIDASGVRDATMIGFLEGVAPAAFGGRPNDFVVSTESASGGCADTVTVEADHFSYWTDADAIAALRRVLEEAARQERAAFLDDTDFSKGTRRSMSVRPPLRFDKVRRPPSTSEEPSA